MNKIHNVSEFLGKLDEKYSFEKQFDGEYLKGLNYLKDDVKEFIRQSFLELLEGLKVEERDNYGEFGDKGRESAIEIGGFNQCAKEINSKIDKLKQ